MKRLAIIGSGALGQLAAHHAKASSYEVGAYYDDNEKVRNQLIGGVKVAGPIASLEEGFSKKEFDEVFIAIGYNHFAFRKSLFESLLSKNIPVGKLVHSSCYIDSSCTIGDNAFLLPGCVLDWNVVIGNNVVLNTACTVAHDSSIENNSFLGPGVTIAGYVKIGSGCFLGINSTIIDEISICNGAQTGGGTVVIKDIDAPGLYVGNPARLVRAFDK